MGDEIWTPEEVADSQGTRRGVKRGHDEIIPSMGGFPGNRNEQQFENPNTVLERKRPDEIRET
jgi:hypothetical protein